MFKPADLLDLTQTAHASLFEECEKVWDALKKLQDYLKAHARSELRHRSHGQALIEENVSIGEGTVVEDGVMIKGPAIIGKNCEIRHNAYIRGNVIVGDHCVIGNSCEFKQAILFNHCQVPHFSYVGDSILGHKAHLGAGVKISNIRLLPGNVAVEAGKERIDTGLRKFGAIIGDRVDIGCNSVLNPGSIIGRGSVIYPNTNWRGVLGAEMVVKNRASQEVTRRRSAGA